MTFFNLKPILYIEIYGTYIMFIIDVFSGLGNRFMCAFFLTLKFYIIFKICILEQDFYNLRVLII